MADNVNIHASGSWVGDTLEEWKKLPTWGKIVAGLVILGVIVYAVRVYSNRNTTAATPSPTPTSGMRNTSGGTLSSSNYPQDANAPIPYQPNYIAPTATPASSATAATPSLWTVLTRGLWSGETDPTGTKALPIFTNPNASSDTAGGIPLNQQIQVGQSVTGNYYGKTATYYPVNYQGKTGYVLSTDLASSPPVTGAPPPNSVPVGQGSSGDGRFHIVQYGENMNRVARAYGLDSWKDFGVSQFWHGQKLEIPA